MVVGQSIGSAVTTAIVVIGGSVAVKRTALAHVLFSTTVGILAMIFLAPLAAAANWVGTRLGDAEGVLALAAFSTTFKLAGIAVFYPFLDRFAAFVTRAIGGGQDTAVSHLDPRIAEAGGSVALEAAYRATLEMSRAAIEAVRGRLVGQAVAYDPPAAAVEQTERFLETLSIETTDLGTIAPRLIRLTHALDHLRALHADLPGAPLPPGEAARPAADALGAWLDATADPAAPPDAAVFPALEGAAEAARAWRDNGRRALLEEIALRRVPAESARAGIDALNWGRDAVNHSWRLAESLRIASDRP
jgi:phosphate:Na+ symporter